jgi:hypothetical protein
MPNRRTNNSRTNNKSATKLDKVLLQHLLSLDRLESVSFLEKNGLISFDSPESKKKAKNRLAYLKRIQESEEFTVFIELCKANNIDSSNLIKQRNIDFEDDSVSFGSSDEEEDYEVEQAQTVTRKIKNTAMQQNMSYEEPGKIISIYLPNGIIFGTAWVATLDPNIFEIVIAEDGMSVLQKTKTPDPESAKELLVSMYNWASDENNMVVQHLNAVLKRLRKELTPATKWDTRVLMKTQEEVIREFVDINGKPTSHIPHTIDADGRQRICFFLKTLKAHEQVPRPAKFVGVNGASTRTTDTNDDDISLDDSSSYGNAASVQAEVDLKLNKMAADIQDHANIMRNEIRADVQGMMKQFMEQMQVASVSQQGPMPDQPNSY